jgi:hypothetical protein
LHQNRLATFENLVSPHLSSIQRGSSEQSHGSSIVICSTHTHNNNRRVTRISSNSSLRFHQFIKLRSSNNPLSLELLVPHSKSIKPREEGVRRISRDAHKGVIDELDRSLRNDNDFRGSELRVVGSELDWQPLRVWCLSTVRL